MKTQIITLFLIINISISKLNPNKVIAAINCGGNDYTDSEGIRYISDNYYDEGSSSDFGINYEIGETKDQILYQTERWSSSDLTYSIPVNKEGDFVLILKFSEVFFQSVGEKVFDVSLGKMTIIKNLDIFKEVGKATALDKYIEFKIKNGVVLVNGKEAKNAFDPNQKVLKIKFIKGSRDNPKINAIVIYNGSINDTNFAEEKKKQETLRRLKNDAMKKQLTVDLRHHPDEVFTEEQLFNEDLESLKNKENAGFFSIFTTKLGIGIIASVCVFFILNALI